MRKKTGFLFPLLFLTACASGPGFNTEKIDINFTESKVRQAVGAPRDITVGTCGRKSDTGVWSCKTYRYVDWYTYLVYFYLGPDGVWRVNSWSRL